LKVDAAGALAPPAIGEDSTVAAGWSAGPRPHCTVRSEQADRSIKAANGTSVRRILIIVDVPAAPGVSTFAKRFGGLP
jgi:hypothetical protein